MDVVIVGLPGSGKSAVGRRLAARHGAAFVDLDAAIEREAGASVASIFEAEGEAGFRARERGAIAALGPPDDGPGLARVIAPGGGAIVDPRNRWRLYRRRRAIWLDARPEVVAQRLRRSPTVRPLVRGRDPIGAVRQLAGTRLPFYAAAERLNATLEMSGVVEAAEAVATAPAPAGTVLLRADTRLGEIVIGTGIVVAEVARALDRLGAHRAILVSEPGAWSAIGQALAEALAGAGMPVERVLLPAGEAAKSLSVVEEVARELARLRVERSEPIVAVGGGAVTDTAGFVAATFARGIPVIHVPTTLAGQVDAAIGGKTGVDLPEGKNLVGAFHQPTAIVIDVDVLGALPERERRAAVAEVVKMAALGDERLFELLEEDGPAIARGDTEAFESGAVAELVERAAWAKVEIVLEDEREAGRRISLNLGHSVGHAIEAATDHERLRHGEAVAYGLRAACRIGVARGATPPERAARIETLLDRLELGREPIDVDLETVLARLATDKKHRGGTLQWVLPGGTGTGYVVDGEVPADLVRRVASDVLAGSPAAAAAGAR